MAAGPIDRFKNRWPNAILPPAIIIAGWRVRNVGRVFVKGLGSIFTDSQQQMAAVVALVGGYLAVKSGGVVAIFNQASELNTWVATGLAAVPLWVLLNIIRSPFIASGEEAGKGVWFGNRFVYNHPELLGIVQWRPEDNGTWKLIEIGHPQRDAMAYISLEFYPQTPRVKATVVWVWNQPPLFLWDFTHIGGHGVRINRGRLWVVAESEPDTTPVIIRVLCHSFVVGKGNPNE